MKVTPIAGDTHSNVPQSAGLRCNEQDDTQSSGLRYNLPRPLPGWRGGLRRLFTGRLTLSDVWLLLPPLILFTTVALKQIHPADFWWHLRTGQLIAQTGSIPTTDLFTFTRFGEVWINQGWLMQLVFYALFQAGGLPLIIFSHAVLITIGYMFVELACLQSHPVRPRDAALATLGALAIGALNWGVRPQDASFLCFGVLVYILERHRNRGGRVIWVLPPLFALWANLHGGFIFGLGLLGIYGTTRLIGELWTSHVLSQATRRLLVASTLAVSALAVNPGGPLQAVQYVTSFLTSSTTINQNMEFQPLNIREADGAIFFALALVFLFLLWRRRVTLPPYQVITLIVFGLGSLYARRIVPWFGMAAGPVFALTLDGQADARAADSRPGKPALNYAVVGLILLLALVTLPWLRPRLPVPHLRSYTVTDVTPVRAADVLCQLGPTTRPFTNIIYASYLAWTCPTMHTFMDTRFELYTREMWQDYLRISAGQFDWEETLTRYDINTIFASKQYEPVLIAAVRASVGWQMIYEDAHQMIFRQRMGK